MGEIQLRNLSKRWGSFVGVDKFDLTIADREFLVLLGPSGCGKTTTAKLVLSLETPTQGDIRLAGESVVGREGEALKNYRAMVQARCFRIPGPRSIRACRWKIPSLMAKLSMARATKPPNRPPAR